jgi:ribosomal-protein-alanine N-acetyltransferase
MRQSSPRRLSRSRPTRRDGRGSTTVRPMKRKDIHAVAEIERRSYSLPWSPFTFRSLLRRPNAILLVAEDRTGIAGYAALWIAAEEAELGNLAVRPGRRGLGIGRLLLEHALREVRERAATSVFLEVRESNVVARQLYEDTSFRIVGVRPDYYSSPREDALVMRLRCPPRGRPGSSLTVSPPRR